MCDYTDIGSPSDGPEYPGVDKMRDTSSFVARGVAHLAPRIVIVSLDVVQEDFAVGLVANVRLGALGWQHRVQTLCHLNGVVHQFLLRGYL